MSKVVEMLGVLAIMFNRDLSKPMIDIYLKCLSSNSEKEILDSMTRCMKELKYFPTVADIIERIDDGFLKPNEAWSKIPKSEDDSVCWNREMRIAFAASIDLLDSGDKTGARMAFIERYKLEVEKSKSVGRKPKYEVSLGSNTMNREVVLVEAVEKGLLSYDAAVQKVPGIALTMSKDQYLINHNNVERIKQLTGGIGNGN